MTGNRLQNGQSTTNHPARYRMKRVEGIGALAAILMMAAAQASIQRDHELADLSLEELANILFTSVSNKMESPAHGEFGPAPARSEFDRGAFLKLAWQP